MKTFAKKIMVSVSNDKLLFKRTLMSVSIMLRKNNQDCEYFRSWIIYSFNHKFSEEIKDVISFNYQSNKTEYVAASHMARKLEKEYFKLINTSQATQNINN